MLEQKSVSIAANATNDNVLTGSNLEFMDQNSFLEFGLVASATGLLLDVFSGRDILAENMEPSLQNRTPVYPEDYTLQDIAAAGERIKIRARNTTAGALTLFYAIRKTPA